MVKVNVLVDWGKAFVDENGNFYCGTTEAQKDNAAGIAGDADLVIYLGDVHSRTSTEFIVNMGLYPTHNLIQRDQRDLEALGVEPGKTVSPQLTEKLHNMIKDKRSGLIVPRHVFFQDYNGEANPQPSFGFDDVAETFGLERLVPEEFLDGGIEYVVNAKHMFNGTATQNTAWLGDYEGVPSQEMNIFSLLKERYGQGEELEFDFTGVVIGICNYLSASGAKQMFPKSKVNIIHDASTHLEYAPLGIESAEVGHFVASKMCKQIGLGYLSMAEYRGAK